MDFKMIQAYFLKVCINVFSQVQFRGSMKMMDIKASWFDDKMEIELQDSTRKQGRCTALVMKFTIKNIFDQWKESIRTARFTRWPANSKAKVVFPNDFYDE